MRVFLVALSLLEISRFGEESKEILIDWKVLCLVGWREVVVPDVGDPQLLVNSCNGSVRL